MIDDRSNQERRGEERFESSDLHSHVIRSVQCVPLFLSATCLMYPHARYIDSVRKLIDG